MSLPPSGFKPVKVGIAHYKQHNSKQGYDQYELENHPRIQRRIFSLASSDRPGPVVTSTAIAAAPKAYRTGFGTLDLLRRSFMPHRLSSGIGRQLTAADEEAEEFERRLQVGMPLDEIEQNTHYASLIERCEYPSTVAGQSSKS